MADPNNNGSGVTLDFSKAQPLDNSRSASPVTLDFSKAQPVEGGTPVQQQQPPQQGGFWHALRQALFLEPGERSPYVKNPMPADVTTEKLQQATANEPAINRGLEKGAIETASGASQLLGKAKRAITGEQTTTPTGIFGEAPASPAETQAQGFGEATGKAVENVIEFMAGDEALKGLSYAAKLKELHPIAALLEKYPRLATILSTGVRQGVVGASQAEVHGDEHPLSTGVATGLTGGLAETGSQFAQSFLKTAKSVAPRTTDIAGETIPKLASQEPNAPQLTKQAVSIGSEPTFQVAQQKGTQQAIKNVATDAANKVLTNFGKSTSQVSSFGDAADQIRAAAKPIFQKLDQLSDNEFTGLKGQMDTARKVMRNPGSYDAYIQAESKFNDASNRIDQLFQKYGDQIGRKDLDSARSAWKDSKVLDKLDNAVERSFNLPEDVAQTTGLTRTVSGNKLQGGLNSLLSKTPSGDIVRVIGRDGLDNLYKIADLTSTPEKMGQFSQALDEVGRELGRRFFGKDLLNTPKAAQLFLLHKFATTPEAMAPLVSALRAGTSPRIYAPLVASLLVHDSKAQQ